MRPAPAENALPFRVGNPSDAGAGGRGPISRFEWRDALVLLGLCCQGFVGGVALLPLLLPGLGLLAIRYRREQRPFPQTVEGLGFLVGVVLIPHLLASTEARWFIGLGTGITATQLIRLTWCLGPRDRAFSIACAITQIAVVSQVVLDVRFLFILVVAIPIIPAALAELEACRCGFLGRAGWRCFTWRRTSVIACLMLAFFLAFPRVQFGEGSARFQALREMALGLELDSVRGGNQGSNRLVFRVTGENLGYLRRFSLDTFRGTRWGYSPELWKPAPRPTAEPAGQPVRRTVKVASPSALRNLLPTDGWVAGITGDDVLGAYVTEASSVVVRRPLYRPTEYEYWTYLRAPPAELSPAARRRYTRLPADAVSPKVREWLEEFLAEATGPRDEANRLVKHFHGNFEYRLGAPSLRRGNSLEEFLFERREGHCERYASALAVLLRARDIPCRVAVGYVAMERNPIGGFYNVRAKHGHAWTEAWFPQRGWVSLDATPLGEGIEIETGWLPVALAEWLEYSWYANVVDFSGSHQVRLVSSAGDAARLGFGYLVKLAPALITAGLTGVFGYLVWKLINGRRGQRGRHAESHRTDPATTATHFYARLLRILERQGLHRRASTTPLEFLHEIERHGHPGLDLIRTLTLFFCRVRYGGRDTPPEARQTAENAICELRKSAPREG